MNAFYESHITIIYPKSKMKFPHSQISEDMNKAKRQAKKIADTHRLKPTDPHWKVEGNKATRNYTRKSGKQAIIIIELKEQR